MLRLQIDGEVALNDTTTLSEGWHGLEQGFKHRWTRGRTPLPSGTRLVVIDLHPQGAVYWHEPAVAAVAQAHRGSRAAARFQDAPDTKLSAVRRRRPIPREIASSQEQS